MHADEVKLSFHDSFVGEMTSPNGHIAIGGQPGAMKPYHLLFGALGSCFYATFLGVAQKKRLTFTHADIVVNGNKREEIPTTLDRVTIDFTITNPSNEDHATKAAELGAKYCSIHETISRVAEITLNVRFVYTK